MQGGPLIPLAVVVLTLNEEKALPACLDSCVGCDELHVLDSGSTDSTAAVARARGVRVWTNSFTSFAAQRNWAIDNIPTRSQWQLHLDADERLTPELLDELRCTLASNPAEAGFYLANKLILNGSWLKHTGSYPAYQMRLFHRGRMRFVDHGHGQREQTTGRIGTLRQPYLHLAFEKGLDDWLAKHERYAAAEVAQHLARRGSGSDLAGLFSADRLRRRRAMKEISFRIPGRAFLRSAWMLIGQGGFLDGRAGWTYIGMMHRYESMISAGLSVAAAQRRAQ